eukprot:EC121921.1.p1 GENE.EC121921.1~~EC121921.1.p1  ORF type:complete len:162 (+),score=20.82 EC121921.1:99-584(+)
MAEVNGEPPVMKLLRKHAGVWESTFMHISPDGKIIDQHKSVVEKYPGPGVSYMQRNHYFWDDGRKEVHEFPGVIKDNKLFFDTARLDGELVPTGETDCLLMFKFKSVPDMAIQEMIHLVDETHCCRTWQYVNKGQIARLTVINEVKTRDVIPEGTPAAPTI